MESEVKGWSKRCRDGVTGKNSDGVESEKKGWSRRWRDGVRGGRMESEVKEWSQKRGMESEVEGCGNRWSLVHPRR